MTRTFRKALFAGIALCLLAVSYTGIPVIAQTSLNSTTLSAALAAPAQGTPATRITVASGTNIAVGNGLVIGSEYLTVQSATASTTQWNVVRGQSGTQATAHASGDVVWTSSPSNYYFNTRQPSGPCVSTQQQATPRIVVSLSTSIYLCPAVSTLTGSTAATWAPITIDGNAVSNGSRYTGWTYTTQGALTIQPGVQFLGSGGALAMTLADPPKYMDGVVMTIQASTAQAHTVTYTAGFYGTTTSSDVATFGGAIGDNFVIYASNGTWRIQSLKAVTIG